MIFSYNQRQTMPKTDHFGKKSQFFLAQFPLKNTSNNVAAKLREVFGSEHPYCRNLEDSFG